MLKKIVVLLFIVACAFSGGRETSAFASTLTEGLVAHWNFNGNGNDLSGNNHQGTLHGNATYLNTEFDKSLYLDGTGDYFSTPDAPDLDFTNSFTMSLWVKPETLNGYGTLINKWVWGGGTQRAYGFYLSDAKFLPEVNTPNGNQYYYSDSALVVNEWQHLILRYDNSDLSVFLNGQYHSGMEVSGTIPTNSTWLTIGAAGGRIINTAYPGWDFNGYIDEVKLYETALTDDQIRKDFENGITSTVPEPGTILLLGMGLLGISLTMRKQYPDRSNLS